MFNKIKRLILNTDDFLASLSLVLIIVVTVVGVIMRFSGNPLKWTEEMVLALFIWFTFIGASSVSKLDGHVSIDYFVSKLPSGLQRGFSVFRRVIMILTFAVVFIFLGYQLTVEAWDKITPVLGIRYSFIDIAVFIGGTWAILQIIRTAVSKRSKGGE